MDNSALSFEHILNATVRMLRTTWKADICIFLQMDDQGSLRVRAVDGLPSDKVSSISIKPTSGAIAKCFSENKIVETSTLTTLGTLAPLIKPQLKKGAKFVLSPVSGETRVLGILILGPFSKKEDFHLREAELLSAGALCAVLSAHWRLYEWMSSFVPHLNHELRTPLTAVQGSIGMLLGGMFGQVGSEVKEMLEMAQKGCERTVRAIEDYIINQNLPKKTL
jgi:transcriptional regulator with GAF, ATPase, and Fis domain